MKLCVTRSADRRNRTAQSWIALFGSADGGTRDAELHIQTRLYVRARSVAEMMFINLRESEEKNQPQNGPRAETRESVAKR